MISDSLKKQLLLYAKTHETASFLDGDPSWFMHQVTGHENQEAMAFIAAALSYGSRKQFLPKIQSLLDLSGGNVHKWVAEGAYKGLFAVGDNSCFYRLYNKGAMRSFFDAYSKLLNDHNSLGDFVRTELQLLGANSTRNIGLSKLYHGEAYAAIEAICRWFKCYGSGGVVPQDALSACKRLCMFLRWMVRDNSPVDLGLWADFIDKRGLIIPLDTHVLTEAGRMGLLSSRTASMHSALSLTAKLAEVFPDDPLKGDFALFGCGVASENK